MSLQTYNEKRRFEKTPEPKGVVVKTASSGNSFVIQKHDARRLHYDFRLEMDGVLKSWAVTRGPSLDPSEKRLAVHVEDHPLSYGDFEGIIPKGQYGGGTVIVWDRGHWIPIGDAAKGYRKGHLEFELHGEKLGGRWHLVRMHKSDEKRDNWLLIKADDEAARTGKAAEITDAMPASVKTGRSLEEVEKAPDDTWNSRTGAKAAKPVAAKKQTHAWPKGTKNGALPDFVKPALAKLRTTPPEGARWLHEIKFDGYRIQVRIDKGKVRLSTRTGLDWTKKFGAALAQAFGGLPLEAAIIDGEIVVENNQGASDFSALQKDLSEGRDDRFVFYAFDLLHLDGKNLISASLSERKALLEKLLQSDSATIRYSAHFEASGEMVRAHACRLHLEGIVSKLADGPYRSGRNGEWIKSKCTMGQEFVVGGYTLSKNSDDAIGSLALGVWKNDAFHYAGRVGTGFDARLATQLKQRLDTLLRKSSPFKDTLLATEKRGLHFVTPELVVEVGFAGWSADNRLRHASFKGVREDKPAAEVEEERAVSENQTELPHSTIAFTNADRVYWPSETVTKADLGAYYAKVWTRIEPFIVHRPLSLLRLPEGIEGQRFFQKHAWKGMNEAVHEIKDPKDKGGEPFLQIEDFNGLMALVQSAALEIHPWGATTKNLEKPDLITMDLDPGDDVDWQQMVEAARLLKTRFEQAGLAAFVKTSGGKGLHVVAPLAPRATWVRVKQFTKDMADTVAQEFPDKYIAVSTKSKRRGKIFVDYLRNGRGSTAVAPYSTRARPGAAVSMPLDWSDLDKNIGPEVFTVNNIDESLSKPDPWAHFFESAKPLPAKKR